MAIKRPLKYVSAAALLLLFSAGPILGQVPTSATIPNPSFDEVRSTILEAIAEEHLVRQNLTREQALALVKKLLNRV